MQYVFKNLSGFIKNYTGIFILIVVCQLVCILLSFFSFGVYQNFLNEKNNVGNKDEIKVEGMEEFSVSSPFPETLDMSPSQLEGLYLSVGEILGDKLDYITVSTKDFDFILSVSDDSVYCYEELFDNIKKHAVVDYGRGFTQNEFIIGERLCIAPSACCKEYRHDDSAIEGYDENGKPVYVNMPYTAFEENGKWYTNIEGYKYEIIAFTEFAGRYYIPYKNMPENIYINAFPSVTFKANLTPDEYEKLIGLYDEYFGGIDKEYNSLILIDNEEVYYYNTNMWTAVLIAVISAIDLALIMKYILSRRRKTLAIFRVNGCTTYKAVLIYMTEILFILIICFAVCLIVWCGFLIKRLGRVFVFMPGAFSPKIYLLIFTLYMLVSVVVMGAMIISYVRRSPIRLLRER